MEIPRLSDSIANDLERRILEGALRPGQRLPPERELAEQLGVSRPSLREGLRKLAAKGLIRSRQGGGTYVTDRLQAGFVDPWKDMLSAHPRLQQDLLELRDLLESAAAGLAAQRASELDLQRVQAAHELLDQAFDSGDLERCAATDVDFHQAVVEASHNALIAHLNASLHRLIHDHVEQNLAFLRRQPERWQSLREQHRQIRDRVCARAADAAAQAARRHIAFVGQCMSERELEAQRMECARRRSGGSEAAG